MAAPSPVRTVGRYSIHGLIAAGGMGSVHFGRILGAAGFAKTVTVKKLHPGYARDERFVEMFKKCVCCTCVSGSTQVDFASNSGGIICRREDRWWRGEHRRDGHG
jgi:hypothetical protein